MKILLKNNKGFKWYKQNRVSIKGISPDHFDVEQAANFIYDYHSFQNLLQGANRFFSMVIENDEYIFASVDHLRMFPLFYSTKDGQVYLSDDADWIRKQVQDIVVDQFASTEFLMTGYVTGENTLFPNVKQLQPGEYLMYNRNNRSLEVNQYFNYQSKGVFQNDKSEIIKRLDDIHVKVFTRLIESLNGKTAVIPLSGGYDSRIIAMMFKRLGYEKVICYTYGREGNWEAKISRQAAHELNYQWFFVPYNKTKWKNWYSSIERRKYFEFANCGTSLPHIQDFIAIEELKSKNLIPSNSVIIPGHTAFLSFSGYSQSLKGMEKKDLVTSLFNKHYSLWNWTYKDLFKNKKRLKENITKALYEEYSSSTQTVANLIYQWELKERHAKFICNSVRIYEFFDFEWRMPLWEKEMISFWLNVPHKYRFEKALYKEYFAEYFNVNIPKENSPNDVGNLNIKIYKNRVKQYRLIYNYLLKIKRILEYYNHPLEWNKLMSYPRYIKGVFNGAKNINSYIGEDFINDTIKKH